MCDSAPNKAKDGREFEGERSDSCRFNPLQDHMMRGCMMEDAHEIFRCYNMMEATSASSMLLGSMCFNAHTGPTVRSNQIRYVQQTGASTCGYDKLQLHAVGNRSFF